MTNYQKDGCKKYLKNQVMSADCHKICEIPEERTEEIKNGENT